jgi:hypothetical protein
MGMVLIIWDRIFGTFRPELKSVKPIFGLTKNIQSHNPFLVVFHEWAAIVRDVRKSKSIRNKLRYVFAPPGWSHDGSSLTTKQIRKLLTQS